MTEHVGEKNTLQRKTFAAYVSAFAATAALLAGCTSEVEATTPRTTTATPTTETSTPIPTSTEIPRPTSTRTTTPIETVTAIPPAPTEIEQPPATIDCLVQKCIALTFDDGPSPYTGQLLDDLAAHDAKATFFVVGNRIAQYADTVREIRDGGHQLANHSWRHDNLTSIGAAAAAADIARTNTEIFNHTGVTPEIMRPPYGATNQTVIDAVDMPQIMWSVDPEDWKYRDSNYVANHVISNAKRGDIVLMHDIHPTTVNAVPRILSTLRSDGYQLVTVDTLLGTNLPTAKYSRQPLG